jgi:hypothetical protein
VNRLLMIGVGNYYNNCSDGGSTARFPDTELS